MRWVNVSPHRSGTQSLTAFVRAHGLKALHWQGPEFDDRCRSRGATWEMAKPLLQTAEVFSDLPWPIVWRDVAATASEKDVSFFLVRRDPKAWVRSVRAMIGARDFSWPERQFYRDITGSTRRTIGDFSDAELVAAYRRFLDEAKAELGSRLTVFDLADKQFADKLARYFGFEKRFELGHIDDHRGKA
jgi:Sulfotransferase domain